MIFVCLSLGLIGSHSSYEKQTAAQTPLQQEPAERAAGPYPCPNPLRCSPVSLSPLPTPQTTPTAPFSPTPNRSTPPRSPPSQTRAHCPSIKAADRLGKMRPATHGCAGVPAPLGSLRDSRVSGVADDRATPHEHDGGYGGGGGDSITARRIFLAHREDSPHTVSGARSQAFPYLLSLPPCDDEVAAVPPAERRRPRPTFVLLEGTTQAASARVVTDNRQPQLTGHETGWGARAGQGAARRTQTSTTPASHDPTPTHRLGTGAVVGRGYIIRPAPTASFFVLGAQQCAESSAAQTILPPLAQPSSPRPPAGGGGVWAQGV